MFVVNWCLLLLCVHSPACLCVDDFALFEEGVLVALMWVVLKASCSLQLTTASHVWSPLLYCMSIRRHACPRASMRAHASFSGTLNQQCSSLKCWQQQMLVRTLAFYWALDYNVSNYQLEWACKDHLAEPHLGLPKRFVPLDVLRSPCRPYTDF